MKGALVVLFAVASIAGAHVCLLSPHQRGSMQSINTLGQLTAGAQRGAICLDTPT